MSGLRTRGQPGAIAAVRAMLRTGVPHAVLLVGPPGSGKTTLALDLAAGLLCLDPDPENRPCGACRSCRMVEHGNHPDLHRLEPVGAGAVISIGGRGERGVRDLIADLALLPVEAGARVAILAPADRMTEDAQSALLKTLEEPPSGAVLILCASDEERLLPTVHSRCVRIRLGPLATADVAAIVMEQGSADAPTANRVARLARGRPGVALAYADAPNAGTIRAEVARTLLDLLAASRTRRLIGIRDLAGRVGELAGELETASRRTQAIVLPAQRGGRRPGRSASARHGATSFATESAANDAPADPGTSPAAETPVEEGQKARIPASERRAAAAGLVEIWRETLRDVVLVGLGDRQGIHDPDLLEDLVTAASVLDPVAGAAQLRRLEAAGEQLAGNVSPELVLDVLALGWRPGGGVPRRGTGVAALRVGASPTQAKSTGGGAPAR